MLKVFEEGIVIVDSSIHLFVSIELFSMTYLVKAKILPLNSTLDGLRIIFVILIILLRLSKFIILAIDHIPCVLNKSLFEFLISARIIVLQFLVAIED